MPRKVVIMAEYQRVLCDKCGFHEFEYDSAWKEYSCKKCGWTVEDAEKISAIEKTGGKGIRRDFSRGGGAFGDI